METYKLNREFDDPVVKFWIQPSNLSVQTGFPKKNRWRQQHEYIEKLNMQAVLSASQQEDEFVKEFLMTYEKIPVLIHKLIVVEIWKEHIFPELVDLEMKSEVMFPIYMVLYHEAILANLLETVLFHQEVASSAEDSALDLTDYCYRKLSHLIANLPLSTTTRILNIHDCPVLLIQLIEKPPWTREKNGQLEKYFDNKWTVVAAEDRFKLTKIEGQVWLALYQLLMNEDCQHKYELNPYRKNVILKLRSYLTEVMLDQIPVLVNLRKYLEQLSMMEPPAARKELLLEQVPEMRENILSFYEGKWKELAEKQSKKYFNPSKEELRVQAKRWADMYNFDVLENLITEPPKCVMCGAPASKRCSRCQNEWYCRRECQVKHWKKHKKACNLLVNSLDKTKSQEMKETNEETS
ncbi:hypothetical protein LSH36_119g01005 [Paralvinella palmiformis]|uniref:Zinc finger MYND domain-containing protein 10 n=1 Tax=Paralvinella palmiformis TaxID=53620 RepID=A0AAD9NBL5_9ANNE|nr:hypothetical protein LSH36_119g01005 [Paralvinella palmiformis]